MFCFLSHLVEDCYFREIELFFLIVGHTHNILDQWFGVLSRAIRGASFIGSYLAMHELYKIAHSDDEADKQPQVVHQLELYHDWRRFYNAVRNTEIHNYGLPHRFKITLDPQLKVARMQYMFMSPTHAFRHMEKWQPVPTPADLKTGTMDGDIPLSPLVIFNGPETVLKALGAVGKTSFTDVAVGDHKTRAKSEDINTIIPVLRQIEIRAIGESAVRMEQEAERGVSDENINLSASQLKQIDNEISRTNSSKGGRIVWIRRSKISDDPEYLNRRPDILPNPKLWQERIGNEPKVPSTDGDSSGTSRQPKLSNSEIAKRKMDIADAKESQSRLISFQKNAAEIALTASHMLKLLKAEEVLDVASTNNIVEATKKFSRYILTPREVNWYRSVESAKLITTKVEAMVEAEIQKPWALLNLPVETPAQKAHRHALVAARIERVAQVEANLRKLLMREGEGEYDPDRQVVSMDGFTPVQTDDIDKMNRPQLEALAKQGKMTTKDIKALKVDALREAVKKLAQRPNLLQIPTGRPSTSGPELSSTTSIHMNGEETRMDAVSSLQNEDGAASIQTETLSGGDGAVTRCSVLECDSCNPGQLIFCDDCDLYFCNELHALHSSHSFQYLLPGRKAKRPATECDSVEQGNSDDSVPMASDTEMQQLSNTVTGNSDDSVPMASDTEMQQLSNTAAVVVLDSLSPKKQRKVVRISTPPRDNLAMINISADLVVPMRSADDNPVSRQSWELDKLKDAVAFIRQVLNQGTGNIKEILYNKFNYPSCYDNVFFQTLAHEFKVDISHLLAKKRVMLKDILMFIINELLI
jgi:hypothetical protein